ncbi:response regulator [Pseudomonas sp. OV546]|uniref:response regulator n=1 Tax=Pseudomonas sp. OV546 TaxID=1881063 RepID=UPI0008EE96B4|nr:response regulator [Pseudomonas sp. OV546]SFU57652.1 Hpt domain-containing protein [Pseudomonas sp. OV546]
MQPGSPPGGNAGSASLPLGPMTSGRKGLSVLVVEDHPAYRMLLGGMLHKLGFDREVVNDGQAALTAMTDRHFDLILTDCQMPVMDGYALAREVRRRERLAHTAPVPIIALTSTLEAAQIHRCLEAGINAWLVKPLTLIQLREILTLWVPQADTQRPEPVAQDVPITWPARATLIETFGCAALVERMVGCLLEEAQADLAALDDALLKQDATATSRHLHRLVGGLAFLGAGQLEDRGAHLITAVACEGVAANSRSLGLLYADLRRYLLRLAELWPQV